MKQVLIFSDSVCQGLEEVNFEYSDDESSVADKNILFHVEAFPGATAEGCVCASKNNYSNMNLKLLLDEYPYDGVVICLGTNDIGRGRNAIDVAKDLEYLQRVCFDANIKKVVVMMLRAKARYERLNEILVNDTYHSVELCEFLFAAEDDHFDESGIHLTLDSKKMLYDDLIHYDW